MRIYIFFDNYDFLAGVHEILRKLKYVNTYIHEYMFDVNFRTDDAGFANFGLETVRV